MQLPRLHSVWWSLLLCAHLTSSIRWNELVAKDEEFAEKASYYHLNGFISDDEFELYVTTMHDEESQLSLGFDMDLSRRGLPMDYLVGCRIYFANLHEMHLLWEAYDPDIPRNRLAYDRPLSLRNEMSVVDLVIDRMEGLAENLSSGGSKDRISTLVSILVPIKAIIERKCESLFDQTQPYFDLVETLLEGLDASSDSAVKLLSTLEDYITGDLAPLVTEEQCRILLGKDTSSLVHHTTVNGTYGFGEVDFFIVQVARPPFIYRGLLVSHVNDSVQDFITNFGALDFGGYMSTMQMRCSSEGACVNAELLLSGGHFRVLALGLAFSPGIRSGARQSMLFLGIGGGELLAFVLKRHKELVILAVDLDETVVALARSHFDLRCCEAPSQDCRCSVHLSDGWQMLQSLVDQGVRHDLLVFDMFDPNVVSYAYTEKDTNVVGLMNRVNIQNLASAIDPLHGVVIMHMHRNSNFPIYLKLVREYFKDVVVLAGCLGSLSVIAAHFPLLLSEDEEYFEVGVDGSAARSSRSPCDNLMASARFFENFGRSFGYGNQISFGEKYNLLCNF